MDDWLKTNHPILDTFVVPVVRVSSETIQLIINWKIRRIIAWSILRANQEAVLMRLCAKTFKSFFLETIFMTKL